MSALRSVLCCASVISWRSGQSKDAKRRAYSEDSNLAPAFACAEQRRSSYEDECNSAVDVAISATFLDMQNQNAKPQIRS